MPGLVASASASLRVDEVLRPVEPPPIELRGEMPSDVVLDRA